MHARLAEADAGMVEEIGTNYCYAMSDKHWVTDPQGIAWETYHTLGSIPMFGADATNVVATAASACCTPSAATVGARAGVRSARGCCT